ncbi:MAG: hypothetical protein RLN87_11725, partial [Parasphingopyxis sp.]
MSALALLAGGIGLLSPAHAQSEESQGTIYWTGDGSTDWFDSANWIADEGPTRIPNEADNAVVDVDGEDAPVIENEGRAPTNAIIVGEFGNGLLTIRSGGVLRTRFGRIGENEGSRGEIIVTGEGSRFAYIENDLVVGNAGEGVLLVADGALAEGEATTIGSDATGVGLLTVTGAGSRLTTPQLQTGFAGSGTLLVQDGGLAEAEGNLVGIEAGGVGTVLVEGVGSRWRSTMQTNIGIRGEGNVTVRDGATVEGQQTALGIEAGGLGTLLVDRAGSLFEAGSIRIGDAGTGRLTLSNGGAMTAADMTIGRAAGSNGAITIDSGGQLSTRFAIMGADAGSTGSAVLTGAGSEWTNEFRLSIGDAGNASMEIRGGAIFRQGQTASVDRDDNSAIGRLEGSNGSVLISGAGSAWISERQELFNVGKAGTGTLTIEDGAMMQVRAMAIGSTSTGVGTVIVDGTGSLLQLGRSSFYVGVNNLRERTGSGVIEPDGGDGTLIVRNGGEVSGSFVFLIGSNVDGAAGGLVSVTGFGSRLETEGVAFFSLGRMEVLDGGLYESTGFYFQNPGSRALVDGTGAVIRVLSGAEVDGQLTVSNGGRFETRRLEIGEFCPPSSVLCDETDVLIDPFVRIDGSSSELFISGSIFETETIDYRGPLYLSNGARLFIGGRNPAPAGSLLADRVVFEGSGSQILFNHSDSDFLFPMPISGNGELVLDSGTTRLTANSSFTGPTSVDDARLIVDGVLANSDVSVEGYSLLGGSGGIGGSVTLTRGAVFAPGGLAGSDRDESAIATFETGDLSLGAGSVLEIDVDDAGNSDRIVVTGSVTLSGGGLNVYEAVGDDFLGSNPFTYTIIQNDGSDAVDGTFGYVLNQLAFLTPSVDYAGGTGNDVILQLTPNNATFIDGCRIDGRTMICEGSLPNGVAVDGSDNVDRLVVRALTEQIAPADGVPGIAFVRAAGPVSIQTEADDFGVSVTGEISAIYAETEADTVFVDNAFVLTADAPNGYNVSGIRVTNLESSAPPRDRVPGSTEIINRAPIDVFAGQGDGFDFNVVASGIQSRMFGEGTTRITNSGDITIAEIDETSTSANAAAIFAQSFGSNNATHIVNEGALTLNGRHLVGIDVLGMDVQSRGGSNTITLVNRGAITGFGGLGIDVSGTQIENFVNSDVRIENYAPITLSMGDALSRGGISLNDNAGGEYVLINEGDLRITDGTGMVSDTEFTGAGGYGINVSVGDTFSRVVGNGELASVLTLENSGSVYAEGDGGIRAQARVFDITNSGDIETVGLFADGLYAFQGAFELFGPGEFGGDIDLDARLDNSGNITVSGDLATALGVEFTGNGDLDNSGALLAGGDGGAGLFLAGFTNALAFNTGTITATGDDAYAVLIADFTVDPDTYDVVADNYDAERDLNTEITFFTDADVTATGANSDGIRADLGAGYIFGDPDQSFFDDYAASATIFVGEGVTVSGGTGTGAGVVFEGPGSGILFNEGTVTALSGAAVIGGEGDDTIENVGTIDGRVALGAGNDTINYDATGIFTGPVDGQAGEDRIVIDMFEGESTTFDFATTDFRSFERLFKRGEGSATLTGTDNGFDAIFNVEAGVLFANAQVPNIDFVVEPDARLLGTGRLGAVSLEGGTLAPGASIGTLTLNGDLVLDAASTFEVEVDDMGNGDLVIVNGSVTLGGATLNVLEVGDFAGDDPFNYLIIDNDGSDAVTGTFGTLSNQFAFLTPSVDYMAGDGNDVALGLTPNGAPPPPPPPPTPTPPPPPPTPTPPPPPPTPTPPPPPPPPPAGPLFPTAATTYNQMGSAMRFEDLDRTPGSDANSVYMNLLFSTTGEALAAFDTASGEIYASLLANAGTSGMTRAQRLAARGHEAFAEGWGFWGGVTGSA